jgi:hypothetical protein
LRFVMAARYALVADAPSGSDCWRGCSNATRRGKVVRQDRIKL